MLLKKSFQRLYQNAPKLSCLHRNASHGQLGRGLLTLLEHPLLQFLRHACAEGVNISSPQGGAEVDQHDPSGDTDGHDPRGADGDPVRVEGFAVLAVYRVALFVDNVTVPGLAGNAVKHPAKNSAQESAVHEVNGETLLAEPEEETAGEEFLGGGRDVDGENYEVDAQSGVASADVDLRRKDIVRGPFHVGRPCSPFWVFSGVRAHEETEADQEACYDLATPAVAFDEFFETVLIREIAEEHAVNCLHLEGFCLLIRTRGGDLGFA